MTVAGSYRRPEPPAGAPQPSLMPWSPVPSASAALRCEHVHGPAGGRLDETARRLSHEELVDASGQAPHAVLMAQGSGLSVTAARQGVARYAAAAGPIALSSVRIVGDGYDLAWARRPTLELDRAQLDTLGQRSARLDAGVGLGI